MPKVLDSRQSSRPGLVYQPNTRSPTGGPSRPSPRLQLTTTSIPFINIVLRQTFGTGDPTYLEVKAGSRPSARAAEPISFESTAKVFLREWTRDVDRETRKDEAETWVKRQDRQNFPRNRCTIRAGHCRIIEYLVYTRVE